jgi:hypothetical protein
MKDFNLSNKETVLLTEWAIHAEDSCGCWGSELLEDNMSYVSASELTRKGLFNKHEVAGLLSSLMEKGVVLNDDEDREDVLYCIDYYAIKDGVFKFLDSKEPVDCSKH